MSVSSAGDEPPSTSRDIGPSAVPVTGADDPLVVDEHGAGDEQGAEPPDSEHWWGLAQAVLADEGLSGELDITFVDEDEMAELNAQHMGHEGPTDVLAFPIDSETEETEPVGEEVPRLLGDVVICPAVARRNAPENAGAGHDGTVDDELALLVVHGVLHILGWDHATAGQRAAMQDRERHHLDRWSSAEQPQAGAITP